MNAQPEKIAPSVAPIVAEAVEKAAVSLRSSGVHALRVLLHAGLSSQWTVLQQSEGQSLVLDSSLDIVQRLYRHRSEVGGGPCLEVAHRFASRDAEAVEFLELCAQLSGTRWVEPVKAVARNLVSVLFGVMLRWLADGDDEAVLLVFDDLVFSLAARAEQL